MKNNLQVSQRDRAAAGAMAYADFPGRHDRRKAERQICELVEAYDLAALDRGDVRICGHALEGLNLVPGSAITILGTRAPKGHSLIKAN